MSGTLPITIMEVKTSLYPVEESRTNLIIIHTAKPSQKDKDRLYKEVNGFSLASHFYWGLWALIQAMISDIDFDYMDYAVLRFNEYYKRKPEVLASLK